MHKFKTIQTSIFLPTVLFSALAIFCMLTIPKQTKRVVSSIFHFMTNDLGWLYLVSIFALLIFSVLVCCSPFGHIKLGEQEDKKEYSDWSWTAMMFAAGMGISVVLLGFTEPISLLLTPPLGAEPMSDLAFQYAHMYDQFAFGFLAWGTYGAASVAVAYNVYVKHDNVLRLSSACRPVLGKWTDGPLGTLIDVLAMLGMIGGISSSLGIGTPAVTTFIEYLTGIPQSFHMTCMVLMVWALIFGTSVFLGLDKGIKRLSDINLYLLFGLMAVVLLKSPVNDILNMEVHSIGMMIDHSGELMLGATPYETTRFTQNWTIFYWAWWLSFVPMMALFGARISRGRTVRQLILGEMVYGGGGSMLVFGLLGGYALHLQHSGTLNVAAVVTQQGRERAVIEILNTLPFPRLIVIMTLVLIFVFLATTIDSTAYTLASVCTAQLTGDEQPTRGNRVLWAAILLLFALGLVMVGGLETTQTASILLGFPMIFVCGIMMVSDLRVFREHNTISHL